MMPLSDLRIDPEDEFPESVVDEMLDSEYGPDNSDVEDSEEDE
jgi:hypothetical protein